MTKIINRPPPIKAVQEYPMTPENSPASGICSTALFGEYFESEGESDSSNSSPVSKKQESKQEGTLALIARHSKQEKVSVEKEDSIRKNFEKIEKSSYTKRVVHIGVASFVFVSVFSAVRYGFNVFLAQLPRILKNNI